MTDLRRAWVGEDGTATDDASFADRFAGWIAAEGDRRLGWLAVGEAGPVGMLSLAVFTRMPRPGQPTRQWGYVSNVFVLRQHRDAGTGRALLDAAATEARARSFARLVLNPSERAVPLYARAGFAASGLLVLELG